MKFLRILFLIVIFGIIGMKPVMAWDVNFDCKYNGRELFNAQSVCDGDIVVFCRRTQITTFDCTTNTVLDGMKCKEEDWLTAICYDPGSASDVAKGKDTTKTAELPNYPDSVNFNFKNATLGTIIGKIIGYVYIFAGMALLLVLIMGGFVVLTSAGSPEKAAKGYGQITNGVVGFIIVFVSYMVVLLIQAIFHVKIFF
jgi:hypothetical protein